MIHYTQKIAPMRVEEAYECDVCHNIYTPLKGDPTQEMEMEEFLHIHFVGGYQSIFGDGNQVDCDICQHCLKSLLGEYLRVE